MSRRRDERGAAVVETPMCIVIVLFIGLGLLTLVQVLWTHLDLASAVRDGTRYAARAEYDPASGHGERRRTPAEVQTWVSEIATAAGVAAVDCDPPEGGDAPKSCVRVTGLGAGTRPGDEVVVTVEKTVSNPLYRTAASAVAGLAGILGASPPFDPAGIRVSAEAVTFVE